MSQENVKKTTSARFITECAMMLAIAAVVSEIRIIHLPRGGSATLASMLPLIIISYRYGLVKGLLAGVAYGGIQQLLGLKNLSGQNWYSVLAILFLDYLLAYVVLGFGGIFRGKFKSQREELLCGSLLAGVMRFVCHFVSGITVWNSWGVVGKAGVLYSLTYNSLYMVPEILILLLVAWYLGGALDFTQEQPARIKRETSEGVPYAAIGLLIIIIGIIVDTVMIFSNMTYDKTNYSWHLLDNGEVLKGKEYTVDWLKLIIISALSLVGGIGLILYSKRSTGRPR